MTPKRLGAFSLGVLLLALLLGGGSLLLLTYQPGKVNATEASMERYMHFRAWGDSLFALANYAAARDLYARALSALPEDAYATGRLEEAERMLAITHDEAYARQRARGDSLFARRNYTRALEAYRNALGKRPGDPIVLEKVQKTMERLLAASAQVHAEQRAESGAAVQQVDVPLTQVLVLPPQPTSGGLTEEQEARYREVRRQGDSLFIKGTYEQAQNKFTEALSYRPDDAYATAILKEIDRISNEGERDEQYRRSMSQGDALFDQGRYAEAKRAYEQALAGKPRDAVAASRLAEINNRMAQTQRSADLYEYFRNQADEHLRTGNYEVAISRYQKALEFRPGDTHAQGKIEEARKALAAKREQF